MSKENFTPAHEQLEALGYECTPETWFGRASIVIAWKGNKGQSAGDVITDLLDQRAELLAALQRLSSCPDLNLDSLEPETIAALDQARVTIARATTPGV